MRSLLRILPLIALAACGAASDSAPLPGNQGTLKFATGKSGRLDRVLLCRHDACVTAPDNEYKTAWGLTVPVINGHIRYAEQPNLPCRYQPINGKEHITCAGHP
ncbi:MAG: hypothetical protein V4735_07915 [Pseudomonadota bacterium]